VRQKPQRCRATHAERSATPVFAPHSPQVFVVCQHARGEPRVRIFNDLEASLADAGGARARAPHQARPSHENAHVRSFSHALSARKRCLGDSPSLLRCQLHCGGGEEDNDDARYPQAARYNDGRVERPDSVEERRACKLSADKGDKVERGADLSSARGRGADQRLGSSVAISEGCAPRFARVASAR
jgi:hypothetical protein